MAAATSATVLPDGATGEQQTLCMNLERCEHLLQRVEAEVSERERQLADMSADLSSANAGEIAGAQTATESALAEAAMLSKLRAEMHEQERQLRGLQEELGQAARVGGPCSSSNVDVQPSASTVSFEAAAGHSLATDPTVDPVAAEISAAEAVRA